MSRGAPSENFKQFLSFSDFPMRTHINPISQNRNKLTERKVIDVGNKRGRAYLLRRSRRRRGAPLPGVSLFTVFDVLDEKSRSVRGFVRTFNLVRPRAITATTGEDVSLADHCNQPIHRADPLPRHWLGDTPSPPARHFSGTGRRGTVRSQLTLADHFLPARRRGKSTRKAMSLISDTT